MNSSAYRKQRYHKQSFSQLPAIPCPCGTTKRAFLDLPHRTASVHYLRVKKDTAVHYHKGFSEIYTILEGEGFLELDGELVAVRPLDTVMIEPGCRHRAIGDDLVILNVAVPAFDAEDEHFD